MFFLVTHPDGQRALVRESYAPAAQTLLKETTKDNGWLQAITHVLREDGAPCVLLVEQKLSKPESIESLETPKSRKTKGKQKADEINGTD